MIAGKVCQRCGTEEERCVCTAEQHAYDGVCAPLYYEGEIKDAVYRIKRSSDLYSARILSGLMAQTVRKRHPKTKFSYVVPVPLHFIKQRLKGYNHAAYLAKETAKQLQIPLKAKALYRKRYTPQQKKLSALDRLMNINGAFAVRKGMDFNGGNILLVDDIKTTGATLNECAKALKAAGAEKVFCLTLAITPHEKRKAEI
jgi:ComF family protein